MAETPQQAPVLVCPDEQQHVGKRAKWIIASVLVVAFSILFHQLGGITSKQLTTTAGVKIEGALTDDQLSGNLTVQSLDANGNLITSDCTVMHVTLGHDWFAGNLTVQSADSDGKLVNKSATKVVVQLANDTFSCELSRQSANDPDQLILTDSITFETKLLGSVTQQSLVTDGVLATILAIMLKANFDAEQCSTNLTVHSASNGQLRITNALRINTLQDSNQFIGNLSVISADTNRNLKNDGLIMVNATRQDEDQFWDLVVKYIDSNGVITTIADGIRIKGVLADESVSGNVIYSSQNPDSARGNANTESLSANLMIQPGMDSGNINFTSHQFDSRGKVAAAKNLCAEVMLCPDESSGNINFTSHQFDSRGKVAAAENLCAEVMLRNDQSSGNVNFTSHQFNYFGEVAAAENLCAEVMLRNDLFLGNFTSHFLHSSYGDTITIPFIYLVSVFACGILSILFCLIIIVQQTWVIQNTGKVICILAAVLLVFPLLHYQFVMLVNAQGQINQKNNLIIQASIHDGHFMGNVTVKRPPFLDQVTWIEYRLTDDWFLGQISMATDDLHGKRITTHNATLEGQITLDHFLIQLKVPSSIMHEQFNGGAKFEGGAKFGAKFEGTASEDKFEGTLSVQVDVGGATINMPIFKTEASYQDGKFTGTVALLGKEWLHGAEDNTLNQFLSDSATFELQLTEDQFMGNLTLQSLNNNDELITTNGIVVKVVRTEKQFLASVTVLSLVDYEAMCVTIVWIISILVLMASMIAIYKY